MRPNVATSPDPLKLAGLPLMDGLGINYRTECATETRRGAMTMRVVIEFVVAAVFLLALVRWLTQMEAAAYWLLFMLLGHMAGSPIIFMAAIAGLVLSGISNVPTASLFALATVAGVILGIREYLSGRDAPWPFSVEAAMRARVRKGRFGSIPGLRGLFMQNAPKDTVLPAWARAILWALLGPAIVVASKLSQIASSSTAERT